MQHSDHKHLKCVKVKRTKDTVDVDDLITTKDLTAITDSPPTYLHKYKCSGFSLFCVM